MTQEGCISISATLRGILTGRKQLNSQKNNKFAQLRQQLNVLDHLQLLSPLSRITQDSCQGTLDAISKKRTVITHRCLEGGSNNGGGTEEGSNRARAGANRARCTAGLARDKTVGQATGSLDGTAEEGRAAGARDGLVEGRLAAEEDGVGDTGCVGDVGLEADVRGEDVTSAGRAELVLREARGEEKEGGVGGLEGVEVGRDDGLVGRVERASGGDGARKLCRAVVATVILRGHRILQGYERVQNIVDLDDLGVQVRRELLLASGVEVCESATNGGLRAR